MEAPGADAYPISSFTWIVVPAHRSDAAKRQALIHFLQWMLGPGQRQAAALGYVALPKDVVGKEGLLSPGFTNEVMMRLAEAVPSPPGKPSQDRRCYA